MPENRRIAFRFGKEFTEEQFNEVHKSFGFGDESDTLRKLMSLGYTLLKHKAQNIEKINREIKDAGLTIKDFLPADP